jgi:hypothetical protein
MTFSACSESSKSSIPPKQKSQQEMYFVKDFETSTKQVDSKISSYNNTPISASMLSLIYMFNYSHTFLYNKPPFYVQNADTAQMFLQKFYNFLGKPHFSEVSLHDLQKVIQEEGGTTFFSGKKEKVGVNIVNIHQHLLHNRPVIAIHKSDNQPPQKVLIYGYSRDKATFYYFEPLKRTFKTIKVQDLHKQFVDNCAFVTLII